MSVNPTKELGTALGKMSKTQDETQDAINPNEEAAQRQFYMTDNIVVEQLPLVAKRRNIVSSFIWGNDDWNTKFWNGTYGAGFILGNVTTGVLGENLLGDPGTTAEVVLVYNDNNVYKEYFKTDLLEDSANTTATWGTNGLVFSGSVVQYGQSLAVAYSADDPQTYTAATIALSGTNTAGADLYLSADAGSNWEAATADTKHTFTNTGTDLRFKIDNNTGGEFPTAFGTWGGGASAVTITKLTITYEVA